MHRPAAVLFIFCKSLRHMLFSRKMFYYTVHPNKNGETTRSQLTARRYEPLKSEELPGIIAQTCPRWLRVNYRMQLYSCIY